jgi:hypothetical protein
MSERHKVKQCRSSPQARTANLQEKCKIALPRPGTYLTRKHSRRLCHSYQYRTEGLSSVNSKPPEVPNSLFLLTVRCSESRWRVDGIGDRLERNCPICIILVQLFQLGRGGASIRRYLWRAVQRLRLGARGTRVWRMAASFSAVRLGVRIAR